MYGVGGGGRGLEHKLAGTHTLDALGNRGQKTGPPPLLSFIQVSPLLHSFPFLESAPPPPTPGITHWVFWIHQVLLCPGGHWTWRVWVFFPAGQPPPHWSVYPTPTAHSPRSGSLGQCPTHPQPPSLPRGRKKDRFLWQLTPALLWITQQGPSHSFLKQELWAVAKFKFWAPKQ